MSDYLWLYLLGIKHRYDLIEEHLRMKGCESDDFFVDLELLSREWRKIMFPYNYEMEDYISYYVEMPITDEDSIEGFKRGYNEKYKRDWSWLLIYIEVCYPRNKKAF